MIVTNVTDQTRNPKLGLISDLRDHRATFPAASLSRVRALGLFNSICPPSDYVC